ncbi:MAG: class I SAM-dependent methyltransferase [Phycisphaerae bacterium]|nr:class I SAM-dependent methyltransferase [Phycisphaerae bacterium]
MFEELNISRGRRARVLFKGFWDYLLAKRTPSRIFGEEYLRLAMPALSGKVIELGGRKRFGYKKFAVNASEYVVTNIEVDKKDFDEYADILNLPYEDDSIDNFVANALLEHVPDPQKAIDEVQRCLKPGGKVLLIVPAMFPRNPAPEEFFRFSPTALVTMLDKCNILNSSCLGGIYTLNALYFRRPLWIKPIGALVYLLDILFGGSAKDRDYPLLLALLAEKK